MGQRFQSLEALTEAARIVRGMDLDDEQRTERLGELRDEAIACLALVDLRPHKRLADVFIDTHGTGFQKAVAFAPKWDVYARAEVGGPISLRRVDDDGEILRLPGSGPRAYILTFSPDGHYLAAKYYRLERPIEYIVWEWRSGRKVVQQACGSVSSATIDFAFTPDSRHVLFGSRRDALLSRYDLTTGKETGLLSAGTPTPWTIAVHPDGRRLASASGKEVTIRDAQTGAVLGTPWQLPSNPWTLTWSKDGKVLAAGGDDHRIHLWDDDARQERGVLEGHAGSVLRIAFNPAGTLLASSSWDNTIRLWDLAGGKELLQLIGDFLEFSPDGRRLAYVKGQELGMWEVMTGEGFCRQLVHPAAIFQTRFSPDDRILASAALDDAYLWDVRTGKQLARLGLRGQVAAALFRPSGDLLTVLRFGSSHRWPVRGAEEGSGRLRAGPPALLRLPIAAAADSAALDAAGHKLVVADFGNKAIVYDPDEATAPLLLAGHPRVNVVDVSPDGRWVVTSTFKGADVMVWDLASPDPHKAAARFRTGERANAHFSLDGRWLVVDEPLQLVRYFYRVGSWDVARQERIEAGDLGGVTSTAKGDVMAATSQRGHGVRLFDPVTGRTRATLPFQRARQSRLSFNRDGSRLAVTGGRFLYLWNLRALRAALAEMGLDWQADPYPSSQEATAEPPLTVTVQGAPNVDSAPVVVLPPAGRRSATAAEIAAWVKQLGDADAKRRAAAMAMAEVGAPAVKALTVLADGPAGEAREQARIVLDRIAVAEALAPTRVRLKLNEVLASDAVRMLSEQTHLPLTYRPRPGEAMPPQRISLDLRDVSLWEAVDRICDAGQLALYANFTAIWASPSLPEAKTVHADAGAFRLEVVGAGYVRSFNTRGRTPGGVESLSLQVRLFKEPRLPLLSVQSPRLIAARGADGQDFLPAAQPPVKELPLTSGAFLAGVLIPLKPSDRRGGKLQIVQGVLPLTIAVGSRDLVTVPDLARAEGRTFRGDQGHQLTVETVQGMGNTWKLQIRLSGTADWSYEPNTHGLEMINAQGRSTRLLPVPFTQRPLREPQSEDIAWLAASPLTPSLLALPWPALALHAARPRRMEWYGSVQGTTPGPLQGPVQLRFYHYKPLKTEVPFELRDVPLP